MHANERRQWTWPAALAWLALVPVLASAVGGATAAAQNARWAIWVMKPDGSEAHLLAQVEGCKQHKYPRWSHDGKRVAFNATAGATRESAIYVVNADGSGLEKIGGQTRPDWSPDDKQVAFDVYGPDRTRSVYVQNLDGEGRTEVAPGISPRWSPDGSKLAISDRNNLCVVDLISGERRVLLRNPQEFIFHGFSWFPDGKRLVCVTRTGPSTMRRMLFVSADGEEDGLSERWQGGIGGYNSFSPDGTQLVFENHWTIHTMDILGTDGPVEIPGQKGANVDPDWSPDGAWIVFSSSRALE